MDKMVNKLIQTPQRAVTTLRALYLFYVAWLVVWVLWRSQSLDEVFFMVVTIYAGYALKIIRDSYEIGVKHLEDGDFDETNG